ncbi:MAG: 6-carboxyhexanoate--CoA ligase [Aquificota bacterium]|nr:MAG: 6-carboxyhexanoate--CoA ligase [Aquificota bacterium]
MLSVRMRAQLEGRHVSGAERLVEEKDLERVVKELLKRPKAYDELYITIERLQRVHTIPKALPIYSHDFRTVESAHEFAIKKLVEEGVPKEVALLGLELLKKGPNPKGGNMRGAVLMEVCTGERLEPDQERGIRTVRFDWKDRKAIKSALKSRGIKRFYIERLLDALALATKNIHCGVLAELCWSDDPEYTTGYVAGKNIGYTRIKPMKEEGTPVGGRVYFVKKERVEEIIECLERRAVLIESL